MPDTPKTPSAESVAEAERLFLANGASEAACVCDWRVALDRPTPCLFCRVALALDAARIAGLRRAAEFSYARLARERVTAILETLKLTP